MQTILHNIRSLHNVGSIFRTADGAGLVKHADRIIEIPMFGKKESLNVPVAFGVVAYYVKLHSEADRVYSRKY